MLGEETRPAHSKLCKGCVDEAWREIDRNLTSYFLEDALRRNSMRLDKYLKNSRIIKRRTVAKEACQGDKVYINEKLAKPSSEVEIGDRLIIVFGEKTVKVEVLDLSYKATKEGSKEMYKIIQE